jgi:hypothetical protein
MKSNRLKAMARELNKELKLLKKNHFIRIEYTEDPFDWVMIMFSRTKEGEWPDGKISNTEYVKLALYGISRRGKQVKKYDGYNMFRLDPLSYNIDDTLTKYARSFEMNHMVLFIVASLKDIANGEYYHGK